MATSTAKKYRVLIGLSYPKSKKIWDRIVDGGERIPFDERGEIVDERPGAIVTILALDNMNRAKLAAELKRLELKLEDVPISKDTVSNDDIRAYIVSKVHTMPAHVVPCFMDMGAIELYVPSKKEADNGS